MVGASLDISLLYGQDYVLLSNWYISGLKHLLESQTRLLSVFYLVLLVLILRATYNRYLHPLRHFPGPFWASVTDFYKLYLLYTGDLTSLSLKQHRTYGKSIPSVIPLHMHTKYH